MIIIFNASNNPEWVSGAEITELGGLKAVKSQVVAFRQYLAITTTETQEEAVKRFDDIMEALAAEQKVYDTRKDIGYWKPKKKTPGRKPAAEKAPAEHSEPAHKK